MNLKRAKKARKATKAATAGMPWVVYEDQRGTRKLYQCGRALYQKLKREDKVFNFPFLNQQR